MNTDTTQTKNLIEALDLAELEPEEQEEILLDLNALIFKGTMVRLMERMDDATSEEFSALLDSNPSEDAVNAFLTDRVADADSAVTETIQDLTDDILAVQSYNT